jgi:hypothetical protein
MRRIGNVTDFAAGLFLVGTGLFALVLSWPLPVGSALRMGPGYLPQALCYLQIALGGLIAVQSIAGHGEPWTRWAPRPIAWVFASIVFFAVAIGRFGLVVSVVGLVLLACLASPRRRRYEAILLAAGLAIFSVLIFVQALDLMIPVWPNAGP